MVLWLFSSVGCTINCDERWISVFWGKKKGCSFCKLREGEILKMNIILCLGTNTERSGKGLKQSR